MLPYFRPWPEAWRVCASGPEGFWRRQSPRTHFRTAAASTTVLAELIIDLLAEHPEIGTVVDLGAGDGCLLNGLVDLGPDLKLVGIDMRGRPAGLVRSVEWRRDLWDVESSSWRFGELDRLLAQICRPVLITCVEWLDDLPCPVVGGGPIDWRQVEVDGSGEEWPGAKVDLEDLHWLDEWWPAGSRAEVGRTRDAAWASVIRSLRPYGGLVLMIDYGHLRSDRPPAGSLAAYRAGHRVPVMPRPDRNLTAAVAVDAVQAAGERAGARTLLLARQADVLGRNERAGSFSAQSAGSNRRIAPRSAAVLPDERGTVASDRDRGGQGHLLDLVERSERAALRSPYVWGGQWWLLQEA
jgi:Putative S-adenosyl-L-methionine-dependent methyltransferase